MSGPFWRVAPGLTVATVLALLVLLGLGTWQLQRLQWKTGLISRVEAALAAPAVALPEDPDQLGEFDYRRIVVSGTFRHDDAVRKGARARGGVPGYDLLTPLDLGDGRLLLVNRGWMPDRADAHPGRPAGNVELTGVLRSRFHKGWAIPDADLKSRRWYWYDTEGIGKALGLTLLPAVLQVEPGEQTAGLPVAIGTDVEIVNNHLQYAITWYALAAVLVGVYFAYLRSRRHR